MHRRRAHLTADEQRAIVEFDRSRVTINEFCAAMNIHPSTYAEVLRRHGLRKWKKETFKERLLREWLREQSAASP